MCNMLTTCCHCDDIVIIVQWIFDDFWIQIAQGPSSACAASVQLLARQACESYSCSAAKGLMKVPNAKKVGGDDDKVGTRASNYHKSPDPAEIISEWHSSELVGCLFVVGNCQILSAVCVCVCVCVCVFARSVADIQACCESKKCEKVRNNMTALEDKKFCILAADKVVHMCIQYSPIARIVWM